METFDKVFLVIMIVYGFSLGRIGIRFLEHPMFLIVPVGMGAFIKYVILA